MIQVEAIFIYPIKSLGGIQVTNAVVETDGLQHDRAWMLVDEKNRFLTQREHPEMALLSTSFTQDGFRITDNRTSENINIPFVLISGKRILVTVWDDTCEAIAAVPQVNDWFSKTLRRSCKLVYMPAETLRRVDPRYAKQQEQIRFTDAFPILLVSAASMNLLNKKTGLHYSIKRFRPNIVVSGSLPHAEDSWSAIRIGAVEFYVAKPCARCVVTTIDPNTGVSGAEPLRTLATYRKKNNKIYFGQNIIAHASGNISCGDEVHILLEQAGLF